MNAEPEQKDVAGGPIVEAAGSGRRKRWSPVDMVEAVVLGIGDTLRDMLDAGREEAQRAHNEAWHRYDELTKHRRERSERDDED
jgi:hypothetical protein